MCKTQGQAMPVLKIILSISYSSIHPTPALWLRAKPDSQKCVVGELSSKSFALEGDTINQRLHAGVVIRVCARNQDDQHPLVEPAD